MTSSRGPGAASSPLPLTGRRTFIATLAAALAGAATGCGSPPEPRPPPPRDELPPLVKVDEVWQLMPVAGLRWIVLTRPRAIASTAFLIPSIGLIVPEERFEAFERSTGIDLRQAHEAAIASYASEDPEGCLFSIVRHSGNAHVIERAFRARLVRDEKRVVERPDLVRVSGKAGSTPEALVVIGPDIAGFQHHGDLAKGPARIAALYATGKLTRTPAALASGTLAALSRRLGPAPARAFARGPFEGELARGARGLLGAATAIGAAARPSAREGIALAIAVAGDFAQSGEAASAELLEAWNDLAESSFGHLLGLDRPVTPALPTHAPDAVAVAVELDPKKLAEGLHAATAADIERIMR